MNLKKILKFVKRYDNDFNDSEKKVLLLQLNRKDLQYRDCPCGSRIQRRNIRNHLKQVKHIRYIHSEYLRLSG